MCILDQVDFSFFLFSNQVPVFFVIQMNTSIPMPVHALLFHLHIWQINYFWQLFSLETLSNFPVGLDKVFKFYFFCGLLIYHAHHRNRFCRENNQLYSSKHTYCWEICSNCTDYENFLILQSGLYTVEKNYSSFEKLETFFWFHS